MAPPIAAMERLFSPCTRYRDIIESREGRLPPVFRSTIPELQELNLDVSLEELLSAQRAAQLLSDQRAFRYADFYLMLGNEDTIAWLTPHASVVRTGGIASRLCSYNLPGDYKFSFNVNGKELSVVARSSEALSEIVDVVRRLLVANNTSFVDRLDFSTAGKPGEGFFDAPSFADLMEQCQSLKTLTLFGLSSLQEDHFRVLEDFSKPGLEIGLHQCRIAGAAAAVLAQVLNSNHGPTKLDCCDIDNFVLSDGLRGNSRLKSLSPRISRSLEDGNRELLAITGALRENKGLVRLDLSYDYMTFETWGAICDSLKTHPTLEVLYLRTTEIPLAAAELKSRIQALLEMLKVNTSIQTILLSYRYSQHEIFRGSVIPYLETNRFRPRVRAIQKTRPIPYRAKILGRALLAVRADPNRFWMLLSGNAEVAFPSTTATITPATNLPTPTIGAASANAAAIAATAADLTTTATVTDTRAASTSGASAGAVAAAPTACQKRKARP
jgi:hypothetical protein